MDFSDLPKDLQDKVYNSKSQVAKYNITWEEKKAFYLALKDGFASVRGLARNFKYGKDKIKSEYDKIIKYKESVGRELTDEDFKQMR